MKYTTFILLFHLYFLGIGFAQEKQYEVDVKTTLNARETPNSNAKVLFTIPDGTIVVPINIEDGWAKVSMNGQIGYISEKYIREIVMQEESAEVKKEWNFRSWFGNIVSLKLCYTIIIILLILNWFFTIAIPRNERLGTRCGLYIALLCVILLTYFGHDMGDLVNHRWTGGWLNGYFLAFVNAIVLSASVVQLYNSFVGCSAAAAKKAIEGTDIKFKQLNIDFFFWFLPLIVVVFLVSMLLLYIPYGEFLAIAIALYTIYIFIKKTIVNYILMKPHYWIATFIPLSGLATMICIVLMIYVSILMLLLGIGVCALCMGAIRSAPEALEKAISEDTSSQNDEWEKRMQEQQEQQSKEGNLSWDNNDIIDGRGEYKRITKVENDTIHTEDGGKWREGFGGFKKIN